MRDAVSYVPTWPTTAGFLCASHLDELVEIDGVKGFIRVVKHDHRNSHVLVVLQIPPSNRERAFWLLDGDVVNPARHIG
jgi:hypothetical protein